MSTAERLLTGALGGFSAVLVKFLGQDYGHVVAHAGNLTADQLLSYKIGYGLLTPILMFLGAFVAWTSDEQKRIKLVALAVAAPAMITTWAGGQKLDSQLARLDWGTCYAWAQAAGSDAPAQVPAAADAMTDSSVWEQIQRGVGIFFGYGKEPPRYWVIVGSFKDRDAAERFADAVNAENKVPNTWVGVKVPPNDYYPVIVGGYSLLGEARALREKALTSALIKDAYLSSGARR